MRRRGHERDVEYEHRQGSDRAERVDEREADAARAA